MDRTKHRPDHAERQSDENNASTLDPSSAVPSPSLINRRTLLKGTASCTPVLLTLHSGAALARSSNLISRTTADATDALGRTQCLDTDSVYPASDDGNTYDLGEPPRAEITAIVERDYLREANSASEHVSETEMCETGGTYYYKDNGYQEVNLKQGGMLVSATALSSFSGSIITYEI